MAEGTEELEAKAFPRPLSSRQRWVAGVVGVSLLIAGTVAVYVTKNDVAASVLLLVGAVIFLAGVLDFNVRRLKFGSSEVEVERVYERVKVAQELNASGESVAAEQIVETLVRAPTEPRAYADAEYPRSVSETIQTVLPEGYGLEPDVGPRVLFDGVITSASPQIRIGVEMQFGTFTSARVRSLMDRFTYQQDRCDGILLVISSRISSMARATFEQSRQVVKVPIELVVWQAGSDPALLHDAITRLIGAIRGPRAS